MGSQQGLMTIPVQHGSGQFATRGECAWATWRSSCEGSVGGVGEVGATCPDEGHQGPVQSLAAKRVSVTARVHAACVWSPGEGELVRVGRECG